MVMSVGEDGRLGAVSGFVLVRAPARPELIVLGGSELVIGRNRRADLVLEHATVSAFHARVLHGRQYVTIEDLDSCNGTFVGRSRVRQTVLRDGQTVRIGPWSLEYCADLMSDRMGLNRRLGSLPRRLVTPGGGAAEIEESTVLGSGTCVANADVLALLAQRDVLRSRARLMPDMGGPSQWVGADVLRLGRSGDLHVQGWFCGGVAAEIRWDGRRHVLTRCSRLARVTINGRRCSRRILAQGDHVCVGRAGFRYILG